MWTSYYPECHSVYHPHHSWAWGSPTHCFPTYSYRRQTQSLNYYHLISGWIMLCFCCGRLNHIKVISSWSVLPWFRWEDRKIPHDLGQFNPVPENGIFISIMTAKEQECNNGISMNQWSPRIWSHSSSIISMKKQWVLLSNGDSYHLDRSSWDLSVIKIESNVFTRTLPSVWMLPTRFLIYLAYV